MSTLENQPIRIRPSASLIIVAPTPLEEKSNNNETGSSNYRILMMKRNAKSSFINTHVYPGGVVDKADDDYSNWDNTHKQLVGSTSEKERNILTNKICAIRETFEECGLLITNPPAHTIKGFDIDFWRQKVHDDANQFKVMCDRYNLHPAVDTLIPFSNWITPVHEKKRYDTLFFITILSRFKTKQEHDLYYKKAVVADEKETVLFDWFNPEEALEQQKDGKILLMPPQWYSLTLLSHVPDYKELISKAGINAFRSTNNDIITILPQAHHVVNKYEQKQQDGLLFSTYLAYPGDEDYVSDKYISLKGARHRLYFTSNMKNFKLERNINVSNMIIKKKENTSNL